ncbi:MAG TPA: Rossmann-like and DUF2520 domain-containing protein [Pyrinomonadaceae bacterium]|jgi:predicted short-subunit dehydrogenase-like oxidoreductase (DUF2520 family)
MKVSIIGVGRLGGALAIALARKDYEIENLISRKPEAAQKIAESVDANLLSFAPEDLAKINSDVVFIAVQDFEIENVSKYLARHLTTKPLVFHTSGSLSSQILQDLRDVGCLVGSFHPLVSISDPVLGANRFTDVYFCIEGDPEAVDAADRIVENLGGKFFSIESKYKMLYHAAAVTSSGHLVALFDTAIEMLSKCGLDADQSREILLPLVESTVQNLKVQTPAEALTGTFARADIETFEKHVEILRENVSEEATDVYLQLGERSVHLAEEQGADAEKLDELRKKISLAKKNFK